MRMRMNAMRPRSQEGAIIPKALLRASHSTGPARSIEVGREFISSYLYNIPQKPAVPPSAFSDFSAGTRRSYPQRVGLPDLAARRPVPCGPDAPCPDWRSFELSKVGFPGPTDPSEPPLNGLDRDAELPGDVLVGVPLQSHEGDRAQLSLPPVPPREQPLAVLPVDRILIRPAGPAVGRLEQGPLVVVAFRRLALVGVLPAALLPGDLPDRPSQPDVPILPGG